MYRVVASHTRDRGEEVLMDMYEVLSLLFLGGSFLIALLAYIDRNNKRKQISHSCLSGRVAYLITIYETNHFVGGCFSFIYYNMQRINFQEENRKVYEYCIIIQMLSMSLYTTLTKFIQNYSFTSSQICLL